MFKIKKPTNKTLLNIAGENDHALNFDSRKVIFRLNSTFELDFLKKFQIHKNYKYVVTCNFAIPPLSDCWKYLQVSFFFFCFFE